MTFYKKWHSSDETPIFKSWILPGDPVPSPLYAEVHYHHPKLNLHYVDAQRAVAEFQGKYQLWFAGAHTLGDRHENAVLSALFIAKHLAPESSRVIQLESAQVE
jgi:predicted NAD/FAD-binding protein